MNVDHDHDEEGNCIPPAQEQPVLPVWRFSAWDTFGIAFTTAGGIFMNIGQGFSLLGREFAAAANYSRNEYDRRESNALYEADRAAVSESLKEILKLPTTSEDPAP